jgi:ketosteroid isomerase-like protein
MLTVEAAIHRAISACLLLAVCASFALANPAVSGKDGGPSGVFAYSSDPQVATFQRQAKSVVERYQDGLNGSDFSVIRTLFAPNAVAEWNEKATIVEVDAMAGPYGELFKTTKFTTDFQFDAVDLHGDIAIVRTHHPVGQTELSLKDGSKKLDMNREIFVLKRFGSDWKIILYTFTTQPRQGEQ